MTDDAPDPAQDKSGQQDCWTVAALCAGGLLTAMIFISAPGIDLWAAGLFYDPGSARFPLAKHPIPLFFNDFIEWTAIGLALFALGGLGWTAFSKRPWAGLTTRAYAFLTLSLITGPALIANALFKENWGRARPRQVTEFGGALDFSPVLMISDQCPGNCSFVSGDASMGFAVLAVALIMPPLFWGIGRKTWIISAIAFGAFIGGVRIVQGAHFLSDVIFAGIFVSLAIVLLKMIVLEGRWGVADAGHKRLSHAGAWASPKLGLVHDEETKAWREEAFSRLNTGGWKRALWLFFRSGPKDFGLPDTQSPAPKEEGRPPEENRPSENGF